MSHASAAPSSGVVLWLAVGNLFSRGADESFHEWALQVGFAPKLNMSHRLALTFKYVLRIRK
jgi:hypothetical protein